MEVKATPYSDLKRRLRRLKRLEQTIRFGSAAPKGAQLVWDDFFDLRQQANMLPCQSTGAGPACSSPAQPKAARHTLPALAAMSRVAYKAVVDEFFARVYFAYYQENGLAPVQQYNPVSLAKLGLPPDADETAIKKRFWALAKQHHPDTGGDAAAFIELMQVYEQLVGR